MSEFYFESDEFDWSDEASSENKKILNSTKKTMNTN